MHNELSGGRSIPRHMGIRERCVAACQGCPCPILCCWRGGAVLGTAGAAVAMLRVDVSAIVVEGRARQDGKDGALLHMLHGIVLRVQERYQLQWRPSPTIPSNQGYVGTCTAHSLLKVIIAQLEAKYGVRADFHAHIQQVIEVADCLNGVSIPNAAAAISAMRAGLTSRGGPFQIFAWIQSLAIDLMSCGVLWGTPTGTSISSQAQQTTTSFPNPFMVRMLFAVGTAMQSRALVRT